MLHNGYSCCVICVVDGACQPAHTPAEFEQSLHQYGPIEAGRCAPLANTLTLRTKMTADSGDAQSPHLLGGPAPEYILTG